MTDTLIREIAIKSEQIDHQRGVNLWLRTWVALGVIVVLTVVGYLIFISSSLAGINQHLQVASDAVTDVNGNTKTLPGQIETVNKNLTGINGSLESIPGQANDIRDNLASVSKHGTEINGSLTDTRGLLVGVASDLTASVPTLSRISSQLTNTSGLLGSILNSTSAIDTNLLMIKGNGPGGVAKVNATVGSINAGLRPTRADLGDILSGLGTINGHLTGVCKSIPINLLHGKQPC